MTRYEQLMLPIKEQAFRVVLTKLENDWDRYEVEWDMLGQMFDRLIDEHNPVITEIGSIANGPSYKFRWKFNHNGVLKKVPVDADNTNS